jgi:hypothetical protein
MIHPNEDYAGQLNTMQAMGFGDLDLNRKALARTDGKMQLAIDLIVSGDVDAALPPKRSSVPSIPRQLSEKDVKRTRLSEMGFGAYEINMALEATGWDIEAATIYLLESQQSNPPAAAHIRYAGEAAPSPTFPNQGFESANAHNALHFQQLQQRINQQPNDKYSVFQHVNPSSSSGLFTTHQQQSSPADLVNPFDDAHDPFADSNQA